MARTYDDFSLELILSMNVVYLCGQIAGVEVGSSFADWMIRVMNDGSQSQELVRIYRAVESLKTEADLARKARLLGLVND